MLYALDPDQLKAIRATIGKNLKKRRITNKVTRQQLEQASGLAYFTIRRIEEATGDYKIDNLLLYRAGLRRVLEQQKIAFAAQVEAIKNQQFPKL